MEVWKSVLCDNGFGCGICRIVFIRFM
jgi:hypothetical protein